MSKEKEKTFKTSSDNSETEMNYALKTDSQELANKCRPRYFTRRSSQGFIEAESSCSDVTDTGSSEGSSRSQNGQKKKRAFKGKAKTKELSPEDSKTKVEKEHEPTTGSQLCSENETDKVKTLKLGEGKEMEDAVRSQIEDVSKVNSSSPIAVAVQIAEDSRVETASDEKEQVKTIANMKMESNLGQKKGEEACQVISIEPLPLETAISATETSSSDCSNPLLVKHAVRKNQQLKESYVRSKRTRKTKNCDCCQNPLRQQRKPLMENKEDIPEQDLHSEEQSDSQVKFTALESPKFNNIRNGDNGPCSFSTPLTETSEIPPFGPSFSTVKSEVDSTEENNLLPTIETSAEQKMETDSTEQKTKEILDFEKSEQVDLMEEAQADDTSKVQMSEEPVTDNAGESAALLGEQFVNKETQGDNCELDYDQMNRASVSVPVDKVTNVLDGSDKIGEASALDKKMVQDEPVTAVQLTEMEPDKNEVPPPEADITTKIDLVKPLKPDDNEDEHRSEQLMESPQKNKNDSTFLMGLMHSPSGMQACCVWSPTASPSTSILKKGNKRQSENDSPSPVNKIRRVSFADPIYREGLADDIDRRSPVVRTHSSGSSPGLNHSLSNGNWSSVQSKYNTTPTKGFLSPSNRISGYKSSKKCLISEMSKESVTSSSARVYPALVSCTSPVETILPQLASNMWARGLGQLVRAKNIKTVGDLSSLTVSEIKLLPIRSPKVFVVRKALKAFYEQQKKSLGLEEDNVFEGEKLVNGAEDTSCSNADEEKLATDLVETGAPPVTPPSLVSEVNALSARFFSEDLNQNTGSQLFTMHQQLSGMMDCIMVNLQSRWRSPLHEAAD